MAKKDILLEVKVELEGATKKLTDLTIQYNKLRKEEQALKDAMVDANKNGFDAQGRSVEEVTGLLVQNQQQQKALKEQMGATSREIQNTIKAEQTYANTLKGKAAQLANEKKTLREIELGQGKLSDAYIKQRKVVADLNAEVTALEREYGDHQRNVGNYESALNGLFGRLRLGWVAFVALIGKGIKTIAEDFVNGTQKISDRWSFEVAGWKNAYQQFIISLTRGDGWRELIANMRTAYTEGKRLAAMMDELFERENSLKIEAADIAAEIEREKIATRDVTRSNEDRIKSAERVIELEEQLAARRKDIAQQELDIRRQQITTLTGMSEAEIDYFVNNYNNNRELINEAIRYNEVMQKQRDIIKAANKEAALQSAGTANVPAAGTSAFGVARQRIADARAVMAELESATSDSVKEVAAVAAKYSMTNDDMIRSYVDAYTKFQQVDADLFKLTSRSAVQRSALIKQMMSEGQTATQLARTESKELTETLHTQDDALSAYVETVRTLLGKLVETDTVKASINQVKSEYADLVNGIRMQVQAGTMSFEEALYYRVLLSQREGEEIQAIEKAAQDDRLRQRREAEQKAAQERARMMETDLKIAWDDAEERFRIRRDYLQRELALEGLAADRRAELEQQLTELMRRHVQDRMDMFMSYADKVQEFTSSWNQIQANIDSQRMQEWEETQEAQKATLDRRLAAGVISQKQYDRKVEELDRDLDKKKAVIARQQAIRERTSSLFSVALNTAQAIMKVWSEVPVYAAPAMTAVVAGVGAAQTAAILSQPLPKARRGGRVQGDTHEQGGVLIEAEKDERIVAAQPSRAFPELLNLISYVGKHGGGIPETGYAARHSGESGAIDYERMGDIMRQAVAGLQVWLSLRELRDAENTQVNIEQLARL